MMLYRGVALTILMLSSPAEAVQETRHWSLFSEQTCDQVQARAENIMMARQYVSLSKARDMNNSTLDIILINEAYDIPPATDTERTIAAIADFGERWRKICESSKK